MAGVAASSWHAGIMGNGSMKIFHLHFIVVVLFSEDHISHTSSTPQTGMD